jgi:hypothetical protein
MFNGEFKNAATVGRFLNGCIDLFKKLGDSGAIPAKIKSLFPEYFDFFTGRKIKLEEGTVIPLSKPELQSIAIKAFEHNKSKFLSNSMNGTIVIHNPMRNQLRIEHKQDLKDLLEDLPTNLSSELAEGLITLRNLL